MKNTIHTAVSAVLMLNLCSAHEPIPMIITSPVANLRLKPSDAVPSDHAHHNKSKKFFGQSHARFARHLAPQYRDPNQESHLLYGEEVLCLEEGPRGWLRISAPEQYAFNDKQRSFNYLSGYIPASTAKKTTTQHRPTVVVNKPWATVAIDTHDDLAVPMGTKLSIIRAVAGRYRVQLPDGRSGLIAKQHVYRIRQNTVEPELTMRHSIVSTARLLIGSPYCWGGRSPFMKSKSQGATSSDCSGFVNLIYRAHGLDMPRNSRSMFICGKHLASGAECKPGDLLFFAKRPSPSAINHVLMYAGDDTIIESCVTKGIATTPAEVRLGKSLAKLKHGDRVAGGYWVYFRSYLSDPKRIQYLRNYALGHHALPKVVTA